MSNINFATRFKELRLLKDSTMKEIANALNLSESTISFYESGQREPKTTQDLIKMADYFNVRVDYLIGYTKEGISENTYNLIDVCNKLEEEQIKLLIEIAKNFA